MSEKKELTTGDVVEAVKTLEQHKIEANEGKLLTSALEGVECQHPKHIPKFDEEAAKGLDSYKIRKIWPRFMGRCEDCGAQVIIYASAMHYIMGDY